MLEALLGKQLAACVWPTFDPALTVQDQLAIAIQINGKLRGDITVARGTSKTDIEQQAKEAVAKRLEGKEIIKVIYVPDRLVNFVVR